MTSTLILKKPDASKPALLKCSPWMTRGPTVEFVETGLKTRRGDFRIVVYEQESVATPHFALVRGDVADRTGISVRIQSECLTGHLFASLSCDCYEQLQDSLDHIAANDGILIYLRQEGRGIGLAAKVRSYNLQKAGLDTVDANLALGFGVDDRVYDDAAMMLEHLGVRSVVLLTNNPAKRAALVEAGIDVVEVVPLPPVVRDENRRYLATKHSRMGHDIDTAD